MTQVKNRPLYYRIYPLYFEENRPNDKKRTSKTRRFPWQRERDNTLEELLPAGSYSWMFPMKTFIDRTVPRYTEIKDKDFYFIMTAADTEKANLFRTLETFRGFTEDCLDGANEAGIIYGTGAWNIGEIKNTPAYNDAYEMGKRV